MSYLTPILCPSLFFLPCLVACGDLSSLTRDPTRAPCSGSASPNHWTAREVPSSAHLDSRLVGGSPPVGLSPPVLQVPTSCSAVLYCQLPPSFLRSAPRCIKQVWSECEVPLPNLLPNFVLLSSVNSITTHAVAQPGILAVHLDSFLSLP